VAKKQKTEITTNTPTIDIPWYYRLKFQLSIVTIVLILVTVAIFGTIAYWQTQKVLNEEIEKNGVRITQEVALLARRYFEELYGKEGTVSPSEAKRRYEKELRERFSGTEASKDIVDVAIRGSRGARWLDPTYTTITAAGLGSYRILGDIEKIYRSELDPSIVISRAWVNVFDTNQTIGVMLFEKEIYTKEGEKPGKVFVALSAQKIKETRNKLIWGMVVALLISVVIGVATSYAMAGKVTKPITSLVRDFAIVSRGNLEHRTHSRDKSELGYLARSFDDMTVKLRAAQKAEIALRAREHELKVAAAIQMSMLPKETPHVPGYDIYAYYRPSREVGGDYYDFINLDGDKLGIVVADVSGKGIPASLVMTMTRTIIHAAAKQHVDSAAQVLKDVNAVITPDLRRGTFVTAVYIILNCKEREICVSNAGHNPFIIRDGETGECRFIRRHGIALGFDPGPLFNSTIQEDRIRLKPGDKVFVYTDGVIECRDPGGEQFGEERLLNLVSEAGQVDSATLINTVVAEVSRFEGEGEQTDDITIATFGVL